MLATPDMGDIISRMADISMDLETDGVWDDTTLKAELQGLVVKHGYGWVHENLLEMGATEIPDFGKYLSLFCSSWWDSTAIYCDNQDEVKEERIFAVQRSPYLICRDGKWKDYIGARNAGDMPVDTTGKYGTFVDERDGHAYRTLDIKLADGSMVTWMASLLEYEPENAGKDDYRVPGVGRGYSACQALGLPADGPCSYGDLSLYVGNEGEKIRGICPEGWHIPRKEEWDELPEYFEDGSLTRELLSYLQYFEENICNYYILHFLETFTLDVPNRVYDYNFFDGNAVREGFGIRCVKD